MRTKKHLDVLKPDTPDWLRSFKGCEHYTDEEATEILHSLDVLAEILLMIGNRLNSVKTATIIPFDNHSNIKAA